MPWTSFGRWSRVVAETASSSSGWRSRRIRSIVPFPAPDVPVTTMTGPGGPFNSLPLKEANELGSLAVRETSYGLRLADPRLRQEPSGLDSAEFGDGHEDVEDLRSRHVFRGLVQDLLDPGVAVL